MNIKRIKEESCTECVHNDICKLKDNLSELRQQTSDLGKLLENQKFQIITYCDYYQEAVPYCRKEVRA